MRFSGLAPYGIELLTSKVIASTLISLVCRAIGLLAHLQQLTGSAGAAFAEQSAACASELLAGRGNGA